MGRAPVRRAAAAPTRRQWYDAFLGLCRRALAAVPAGDPVVRAWADHIAGFVTGFPDGDAVFEGDALPRAVATWMVGVTVFHTADHYSFGHIPLGHAPLRLRIPPPDQRDPAPLTDLNALVSPEDHLRRQLLGWLLDGRNTGKLMARWGVA